MRRHIVIVVAVVAVLAAFTGCGADDAKPSLTPVTTSAPSAPAATPAAPAATPRAGHTGVASIDAAIDAMLITDLSALRAMIRFTPTPCVISPEGLGALPTCRPGEAEGTAVDVLPIAQCEGFFARPDELALDGVPSLAVRLYAVYRAPADVFPPGKYFVLFSARAPGAADAVRGFALVMTDDGITGIHFGCAQTPEQIVEFQRLTDAIVAPAP